MTDNTALTPRRFRRWVPLLAVLLLLVVIGAVYYGPRLYIGWTLYQQNLHVDARLGQLPPPVAGEKILIFSPHEDDEVLGCGGYCSRPAVGAKVHIVLMTNGDYLYKLVGYHHGSDSVAQASIKYGYRRQRESLAAEHLLGLPATKVTFLGYPNGPLYRMWLPEHWFPNAPAQSSTTLCTRSPYTNAFTPDAIYCGQSVVEDMETIMRRESPTVIFSLQPNEINADHWATGCYVNFALNELRAQGVPFARQCRVYTYLIHRQHWPAPMGYHPDQLLEPPASLVAGQRTTWLMLPLTPARPSANTPPWDCS